MNLALKDPSLLRDALFVGGTWQKPDECDLLEVRNPATGAAVTSVPSDRREDVVGAIDAAEQALPAWSARPAKERSALALAELGGNGVEDGIDQGPLIDELAVRKTEEHLQDALDHGARVVVGAQDMSWVGLSLSRPSSLMQHTI